MRIDTTAVLLYKYRARYANVWKCGLFCRWVKPQTRLKASLYSIPNAVQASNGRSHHCDPILSQYSSISQWFIFHPSSTAEFCSPFALKTQLALNSAAVRGQKKWREKTNCPDQACPFAVTVLRQIQDESKGLMPYVRTHLSPRRWS